MTPNPDICFTALRSKDARFDGIFFVGIKSTGIYCRPVCTARPAKRENCLFFSSAAAAEKDGFRPCLRCRPELAPGNAPVDMKSRITAAAIHQIEDGLLQDQSVSGLAENLGITDRHLRRIFKDEFGVAPVEYVQTKRLLLAKHLLTDTRLSITEIAYASGFSSLRRFNALFRERYRLNPTQIRKSVKGRSCDRSLTFELGYRPPLDWMSILDFMKPRSTPGVEVVKYGRYYRTATIDDRTGWISVETVPGKPALRIVLSDSLTRSVLPVMARVKALFDLTANPSEIVTHLQSIPVKYPGIRVPGAFDGFEMAVRAILGQQITVQAATTLSGRFAAEFGDRLETPYKELLYVYPKANTIAGLCIDDIAKLGIIASRAQSIISLAGAVSHQEIRFSPGVDVEETMKKLRSLPGIGEWTAQYLAMRVLGWPDAFPHTDLGIKKALGEDEPQKILETAEQWRPWRAYAAMHLWKTLEKQP